MMGITDSVVINPFVSEAQRRACYAQNDPRWDCAEWESKTKGRLPKKKGRKKLVTNRNPLRTDPTRTAALRRAFYRAVMARLNELKRRVNTLVLTEKSFSLNVFCPTGEGGGVDPTCSPSGSSADAGAGGKSLKKHLEELRPAIAKAAQKQYDEWQQDEEGVDEECGSGGICDLVSGAISDVVVSETGADVYDGGQEGDDHAYPVFVKDGKAFAVDIPPGVYESGGGYSWKKIEGVTIEPRDIEIFEVDADNFTENTSYKFMSLPAQVEAFRKWLAQNIITLFGSSTEAIEQSFWYQYVQDGFEKGAGRAFDSMSKTLGLEKGAAKWQFLRTAFANPVAVDKVKLIAGRVFTELKGVTDDMAQQMTRTLADGLVQGQNPRVVAKEMTKTIDTIGPKRALVIARTETSRAHAEGQLLGLEKLGVQRLGIQVEWSDSGLGVTKKGNPSPCPLCAPHSGKVYLLSKASGLIPFHPSCLCTWIPYTGFGEKKPMATAADYTTNVFCATGEGGGIDPTCSPHGIRLASDEEIDKVEAAKDARRDSHGIMSGTEKEETVSKDDIVATQKRIVPAVVEKYMTGAIPDKGKDGGRIAGVRYKGKVYLDDGHHRVAAGIRRGATEFKVMVRDLDTVENVFCPTGPGGGIDPTCSPSGPHKGEVGDYSHGWPKSPMDLKVIKTLPGSTGAQLVEDEHGNKYVRKKGKSAEHLRNEYLAEQAYRAAGVLVPDSTLYETDNGPVKLSKFIEGKMLNELPQAGFPSIEAVRSQLQKNFAADAVLADWDVIGLSKDNILVTGTGLVYRIDVGGSLLYRAQGAPKGILWNDKADEINTMRTLQKNASSVWAFGGMTKEQVKDSVVKLFQKQDKFLEAFPDSMKAMMKTRMNNAAIHAENIGKEVTPPPKPVAPKPSKPVAEKKPPKEIKIIAEPPTSKLMHVAPLPKAAISKPLDTHQNLMEHIEQNNVKLHKDDVKFSSLYMEKIKILNPNGIEGNVFTMPRYEVSKKNAHLGVKYLEKIKSMLPDGTIIKQGYVTKEGIAHPSGPKIKMFKKIAATVGVGEGSHWYAEKGTGQWGVVGQGTSHTIKAHDYTHLPKDEAAALPGKLTSQEHAAISSWKGSAHPIRKAVSEGDLSGHAKHFLTAIEKAPDYKGTLYRGIHGTYAKEVAKTLIENGVGGTWQDDAPMGCSRNIHTPITGAGNAELLFKVTKVHNGKMIEDVSSHQSEHEVVMPLGSKYRITAITKDPVINGKVKGANGKIHTFVEMEQLPGLHFEKLIVKSPTGNESVDNAEGINRLMITDGEELLSTVVLVNPDGNVTHIGKYVQKDSDSIPTLGIA